MISSTRGSRIPEALALANSQLTLPLFPPIVCLPVVLAAWWRMCGTSVPSYNCKGKISLSIVKHSNFN